MAHWTFLSNHGQVLLSIAKNPHSTTRQIAGDVGITERATQSIIADLEEAGYLTRKRIGRRNDYELHLNLALRHPNQEGHSVIEILAPLLQGRRRARTATRPANGNALNGAAETGALADGSAVNGTVEPLSVTA
jgi:DNA-binding IclR family transcriptional regulator